MEIYVNEIPYAFRRSIGDIETKTELNIWKTEITISETAFEFEVWNECAMCNRKFDQDINWDNVVSFLELLPSQFTDLVYQSSVHLHYLAQNMKFWREEFNEDHFFFLESIEYKSVRLHHERLKRHLHVFDMVFSMESKSKDRHIIDPYGVWISSWTGNQIVGIRRTV